MQASFNTHSVSITYGVIEPQNVDTNGLHPYRSNFKPEGMRFMAIFAIMNMVFKFSKLYECGATLTTLSAGLTNVMYSWAILYSFLSW